MTAPTDYKLLYDLEKERSANLAAKVKEVATTPHGVNLRDYFAAKAMAAIIAKSPFLRSPATFEVYDKTAIGAYDYADAMIKARAESP